MDRTREADRDGSIRNEATRAQTTLDFAIGAGVFLLAVAFVVAFVPGMYAPFDGSDDAQVADRVAGSLSADRLGDPMRPGILDSTCTEAFFAGPQTAEDCRYDTEATTAAGALGLDDSLGLNVSIAHPTGGVASLDGTTLAVGEPVPTDRSVTSARRVVYLGGESYRLLVWVW